MCLEPGRSSATARAVLPEHFADRFSPTPTCATPSSPATLHPRVHRQAHSMNTRTIRCFPPRRSTAKHHQPGRRGGHDRSRHPGPRRPTGTRPRWEGATAPHGVRNREAWACTLDYLLADSPAPALPKWWPRRIVVSWRGGPTRRRGLGAMSGAGVAYRAGTSIVVHTARHRDAACTRVDRLARQPTRARLHQRRFLRLRHDLAPVGSPGVFWAVFREVDASVHGTLWGCYTCELWLRPE